MSFELTAYETGPGVFDAVPTAANAIATVMDCAAAIEVEWAMVLAILAGTEFETAMFLLQQSRNPSSNFDTIVQIAKRKLPVMDVELVEQVVRCLVPHREMRNNFAHCIWVKPLNIPSTIVFIRPRAMVKNRTPLFGGIKDGFLPSFPQQALQIEQDFCFDAARFEAVVVQARKAHEAALLLTGYLAVKARAGAGDSAAAEIAPAIKGMLDGALS